MLEALLGDLGMHSGDQELRCMAVPKVMKPDPGEV